MINHPLTRGDPYIPYLDSKFGLNSNQGGGGSTLLSLIWIQVFFEKCEAGRRGRGRVGAREGRPP